MLHVSLFGTYCIVNCVLLRNSIIIYYLLETFVFYLWTSLWILRIDLVVLSVISSLIRVILNQNFRLWYKRYCDYKLNLFNRLKHLYCILLFWLQLVKYIYFFTDQLNSITLCLKLCIHWDIDLTEAVARPSQTNPNNNFLFTMYLIIYEMTSSNNKRHKRNSKKLLKYPTKEITCTLVKLVRG